MKLTFGLTIFLLLPISLLSQQKNFEGLIKYELQNPNTLKNDTIIYYFGKTKIRVKRTGDLTKKYGAISDIFYDFKQETMRNEIWSEQKQELTSIELESGDVVFQQIDTTGVTKILNQNCNKYITELKPTEYLGYNVDNTNHILVANNLYYQLPKNWDFYSSIFSNGTGKIALESTSIIVIDSPYEIGKKPPSVLRAVEIIERKIEEEELILELNK